MRKFFIFLIDIVSLILVMVILTIAIDLVYVQAKETVSTETALTRFKQPTCDSTEIKQSIDRSNLLTNENTPANAVIGYIYFPTTGTKSSLVQGDVNDGQIAAMDRGQAHDPRTLFPGSNGNSVIAGHRHLAFKDLGVLTDGDPIVININNNIFTYRITKKQIITPDQADIVFRDSTQETLTLYTCWPLETWLPYNERVVVYADPVPSVTDIQCEKGAN
ncbi:MAG: sortase [Mycoplasmatales bacterium]